MAALLLKLYKPESTMIIIFWLEVLAGREQASLGDNIGVDSFDQIRSLISWRGGSCESGLRGTINKVILFRNRMAAKTKVNRMFL